MPSGRIWTEKEIEYLRENWGEKTIPQLAKNLNRTTDAIKIKSQRIGLGAQTESGELMTARAVSQLMGVDVHTVTDYWIPKCGLRGKSQNLLHTGKATLIKFSDLLVWLEKNQDKWDSRKLDYLALGYEYDWLVKKRESDRNLPARKAQKWTAAEDAQLVHLVRRGVKYADIGERLNRSFCAVEHRAHRIDIWGSGKYIGDKRKSGSFDELALKIRLLNALKARFNMLNFDGYWQKDMCMHWDAVKGCKAKEINCDECVSYQKIPEQYCVVCGKTFIERQKNRVCKNCRESRKQAARRKYAVLNKKLPVEGGASDEH